MQPRYIAAIEIGSSTIKGAVATVDSESGRVTVIAREQSPSSGCVRYGWIHNEDEAVHIIEQIVNRLESNPRVAPMHIRTVYVAIGGRSLRSTSHDVTLNPGEERKITNETLAQLERDARQSFNTENEILEISPRRFVIDGGVIENPIGAFTHSLTATYNVITCRPQMIRSINRVFEALSSRLRVTSYIVRPLAESAMVLSSDACHIGCAMVDIGSDTTSVVVYKGEELMYLATIPMGSHNITRDLTSLGVTIERAEAYKLNCGDAGCERVEPAKIPESESLGSDAVKIVQTRAGEIVANIVANIEYSGVAKNELPEGIVLVGGGSYLRNLDMLLEEESGMKVKRGSIGDRVNIDVTQAVADRSIDIISALLKASQINTSISCLEEPLMEQVVEDEAEPEVEQPIQTDGGYVVDHDNDPDILKDDEDPIIQDGEEDEDEDLFDKKPRKPKKPSIFNIFAQRTRELIGGEGEE